MKFAPRLHLYRYKSERAKGFGGCARDPGDTDFFSFRKYFFLILENTFFGKYFFRKYFV